MAASPSMESGGQAGDCYYRVPTHCNVSSTALKWLYKVERLAFVMSSHNNLPKLFVYVVKASSSLALIQLFAVTDLE